MVENNKTRYSDEELEEFRAIINEMLEKARAEYNTLREAMTHAGGNDILDTAPTFKTVEDDGAFQLSKEEAGALAQRQYKFIQNLEAALVRIENKTYGICRVTGKLIPRSVSAWCRTPPRRWRARPSWKRPAVNNGQVFQRNATAAARYSVGRH